MSKNRNRAPTVVDGEDTTTTEETTMDNTDPTLDSTALKAKKKEAADRMKARKDAALNVLIELAQRIGTDEEKAAAVYMTPGRHVAGAAKVTKPGVSVLDSLSYPAHEDAIYTQYKLGRAEMRKEIQKAVSRGTWVSFDPTSGFYDLAGTGPEAPEGWLGPMPKQPKAL